MTFFSDSYKEAREKFLKASVSAGATVDTTELLDDLAIDICTLGESGMPTLVVTSGLHGVEGFFGSAVQLAILESLQQTEPPAGIRIVLVHTLNPYGFENVRRFDQSNIDLNRNFLKPDESFTGAPAGYAALNAFLNPGSPISRFEPYRLKALFNILRYGMPALKEAIVRGQYEYPEGLFFGGSAPAISADYVAEYCESWVEGADTVCHIDLHSGLGGFGVGKILINETPQSEEYQWYVNTFGSESIGTLQTTDETAYVVTGSMGDWLQHKFKDRNYYFAGAEFGTYGPVRVLGAIRAENCAHHFAKADSRMNRTAKAELMECFCPKSDSWRNAVIQSSMDIISSAIDGLQASK